MDEPVSYDTYLEVDRSGTYTALILDLPGCEAFGSSQAEALAALSAEIPQYYAWLKAHDDYTPDVRGAFELVPRQVLETRPTERGETHVFFDPDAIPVDDEDMDWGTALIGWATADMVALASRVPRAALDAIVPGGGRTMSQTLLHVARAQLWFRGRMQESPARFSPEELGSDPVAALTRTTATLIGALRASDVPARAALREHDGERWSTRKTLRRSVQHVRTHTSQVARDAASLGVVL